MTSVKLKFRVSSVPNKEGTLYFQIIHNRTVKQIKTSYHIAKSEWNEKRNEIIRITQVAGCRAKKLKLIRDKIEWEKRRIESIIEKLGKGGQHFTVEEIVKQYSVFTSKKISVFEYINKQIDRLYISGKERTSETYRQVLHSFMKFRNNEDLDFDMINDNLIEQYERFMRMADLCRNTTSFYMRTLRSIYNRAVSDGFTTQTEPFKRVYTGVDKTAKRALNLCEIKRLKDLNLEKLPSLDFARDIFMFSFYMRGMSFIDIAYLKKKNLSDGYVVYNRKKTGQQLVVKWEGNMDEIAKKYFDEKSEFLMPIIKKQDGTERKQYLNKMLIINRRLKKIAQLAGISMPLSLYVARHSWASIAQSQNVPLRTISLGMGHDNEETTRIYLSSIQSNIVDKANSKILNLIGKKK
ncbi:site-specific integrase [Mediterranea massiliensis]|uniref:site-specific integrase n=1 Tax=Mediterranea massiliensis TaxID=1841865 RepID=UPI00320B5918